MIQFDDYLAQSIDTLTYHIQYLNHKDKVEMKMQEDQRIPQSPHSQEKQQYQKRKVSYFLFINSKSGGGLGRQYLTIPSHRLDFYYNKNISIAIHLIDLFSEEQKERALGKLFRYVKKVEEGKKRELVVVVCGGDGTVMWVVELVAKYGINTDFVTFSIIPIGTGNDFSRCLGWGGSPITFSHGHTDALKTRILQWLSATSSHFDLWTLNLQTYADGSISQIRDKRQIDTKKQILTRSFCNYFGIGIDARICYSVQMRRQNSKWVNLMLYGCIGFCKLFKGIRSTKDAVKRFWMGEIKDIQSEHHEKRFSNKDKENVQHNLVQKQSIQAHQKLEPFLPEFKSQILLKPGYKSILVLNSVRYMAGLKNVWNTSTLATMNKSLNFTDQTFSDGRIQILSFKNQLQLGLQRFLNCGARVAQGEGPFHIEFNRSENQIPTFVHIDGEAMKFNQLKSVVIKKNELVKDGRIKVLIKRKEK